MARNGGAVAGVLLVVLAAGCGGSGRGDVDEQFATLAKRPATEEMIERYEQMQAHIRQELSAEVSLMQWVKRDNLSGSGCSDFSEVGEAENVTLDRWTSEEALPDARWDRAVQIVTEITRGYGFEPPEVVVDRPRRS